MQNLITSAALFHYIYKCDVAGNPHHRVHEFWLSETIPEEDQEKCSQNSTSILEAMVHSDSLSAVILAQVEF